MGFYPTIEVLKVCFYPAPLPHPTVGKEKDRDRERSNKSENNQLARRSGEKEAVKEQEKVKNLERYEEFKSNQLITTTKKKQEKRR